MLQLTAATVGRLKPQIRRQARAALAMDHIDLTFDDASIRRSYPDLPRTSVTQVLTQQKAPS